MILNRLKVYLYKGSGIELVQIFQIITKFGLNFFDFDRKKPSRLFQLAQLNLWIGAIGVLHLEGETG